MISPKLQAFVDRLAASADKSTAFHRLGDWLQKNTFIGGKPYNFKGHECHEEILRDVHPRKNTKKCSQVGLSEVSLRIALAIAAVTRSRIIYTLPTDTFAQKFSKDRFTPVIEESPVLRNALHADAKSAEMKKIGNSTLYIIGTFGQTQAISIPANFLIHDELDFSNQDVIGTFQSRLRHAEEDPVTHHKGVAQRFSTPTLPNFGISKHFDQSDQRFYMVTCSKCSHTFAPHYTRDFVVPGFDDPMTHFDKSDLYNPKYKTKEAYIKCERCGNDMWKDLINPAQRQWVAKYPSVYMERGYQVNPWDVPKYNSCPSVIGQISEYTKQDFFNFVLGLDYESKDNSFLSSIFQSNDKSQWMSLAEAKVTDISGTVIGMDIGKNAWLVVGKPVKVAGKTKIDIIHLVQLRAKVGDALADQAQEYIEAFNPAAMVVDAAPDFSTAQALVAKNRYGRVFGCEYSRTVPGAFSNITPDPEEGILKAARSGTLSDLMEAHNAGLIRYPDEDSEMELVKTHLGNTKKLIKPVEMGEQIQFVKTGEDHYAHAMNYMSIAAELVKGNVMMPKVVGVAPGVTGVRVGSKAEKQLQYPY